MSLASEARILSTLSKTKQTLKNLIFKEAESGATFLRLDYLHCSSERIKDVIHWLETEDFKVKIDRVMERLTGFGCCGNDNEEEEKIYYNITW